MPAIRGNGAEDGDKDSRKIEERRERDNTASARQPNSVPGGRSAANNDE